MGLKCSVERGSDDTFWEVTFDHGSLKHSVYLDGSQDEAWKFARQAIATIGNVRTDANAFEDYIERRWGEWIQTHPTMGLP